MAGAGKKWAIGCGIGCGLVLLILGGVGTCGYFAVRDLTERGDDIEAVADSVKARYGEPEDFTPPADGRIPAARVEAFLAARDSVAPCRGELSRMITAFDSGGVGGIVNKVRMGFRMVPTIMDMVSESNAALLAVDMSPGEYDELFVLSFYGLLAKDPADGPHFSLGDRDDEGEHVRIRTRGGRHDEAEVRRERDRAIRRQANRVHAVLLGNQLAAVEAGEGTFADAAEREAWRQALVAEIAAMKSDLLRLPWQDGLPDRIRESLEPFRDRLEATYDPMTAMFEMGILDSGD